MLGGIEVVIMSAVHCENLRVSEVGTLSAVWLLNGGPGEMAVM